MKYFVFITLFLIFSSPAYAYLDPGSGNALLCLIFSLFGGALYFTKSLFYKCVFILTGKKNVFLKTDLNNDICIFS